MNSSIFLKLPIAISVALVFLATLAPAQSDAHHSFAMFDNSKHVNITGTVTDFQWTNPHVYIEINVDEDNAVKHYTIECASISILKRMGWKREDLKPGDKATINFLPLRDGRPGGLMDSVTLPDGRKLGNANDQ